MERSVRLSTRSVIEEQFKAADTDKSGTLSLPEVINLVDRMNVGLSRGDIENLFNVGN